MESGPSLDPNRSREGQDGSQETEGHFPMPSPVVAALAVLTLLGFGVLLGSLTRPEEQSPRVLLAASPSHASSPDATNTPKTPAPAERKTEADNGKAGESGGGESSESQAAKSEGESSEGSTSSGQGAAGKGGPKTDSGASGKSGGGSDTESSSRGKGAAGSGSGSAGAAHGGSSGSSSLPPIKHVFVIVLADQGYEALFGSKFTIPYLSKTLRDQGELISDYYAIASGELANEIALISGQGPTPQTAENCPTYERLSPGKAGSEGQTLGSGCVYPISTLTIGDQLTAAGKSWKAYIQGLGEGQATMPACPHPALGAADPYSTPSAGEPYVTWRDPFLYFSSVTESSTCGTDNVGISQLAGDLKSAKDTPSLSYISPDPCDDGSPTPCAPGANPGLAATEGFLRQTVPEIEASTAYKEGGLMAILADQAPQSGPGADASGCCTTQKYPNMPAASSSSAATGSSSAGAPIGGGRVGLLLISKYVKPDDLNVTSQYNHFSLLASIEALFSLKPLGYAGNVALPTFDAKTVYNASG